MYLLDTNACIGLIGRRHPSMRTRLHSILASRASVMVSAIAAFELWYGAAKSARPVENANVLDGFFLGPIGILPFESEDSRVAGELRASLERIGKPIGAYDVLIAAQAIRHNLILVTANVKEFGRLKGLKFEDWTKE